MVIIGLSWNVFNNGNEAELKEAFGEFDADGSGLISCQELLKAIKSLGIEVEIDMVEEMIRGVDGDATGDISFVEFIKLWNENFDWKF